MRPQALLLLTLATAGCPDPSEMIRPPPAQERAKERADKIARLNKGELPVGTVKEWDDAGTSSAAKAPPLLDSIVEDEAPKPVPAIDPKLLTGGWRTAKTGDYVVAQCSSFVNKYGNKVLRRVQLRLEVTAHDDTSVVLRVRGRGVEEHDSSRPEVKKKQWSAEIEGAGELVMARDETLGAPTPARHLSVPRKSQWELSRGSIDALCSAFPATQPRDKHERCVAEDTGRLYLTAGVLSETLEDLSCQVTDTGNTPPAKKLRIDVAATEWINVERSDSKFRERVIAAGAGLVKVEFQRLAFDKSGTVTFNGKQYTPGFVDARRLHVLDWALQRVMPEFPRVLNDD